MPSEGQRRRDRWRRHGELRSRHDACCRVGPSWDVWVGHLDIEEGLARQHRVTHDRLGQHRPRCLTVAERHDNAQLERGTGCHVIKALYDRSTDHDAVDLQRHAHSKPREGSEAI